MGISTQPIYKTFGNMGNLKKELFVRVYNHLSNEVFRVENHPDPVVNLALNYIQYAQTNPGMFRAIYLEKLGSENNINDFSFRMFADMISGYEEYADLDEEQTEALMHGVWVVSTGMANLISSDTIAPTRDEVVRFLEDIIDGVLKISSIS